MHSVEAAGGVLVPNVPLYVVLEATQEGPSLVLSLEEEYTARNLYPP